MTIAETNIFFMASPKSAEFDRPDYGFYLARWLIGDDTVDTCNWVFYNKDGSEITTDLTLYQSDIRDAGKTIAVFIEDGLAQTTYKVEAQVTTVGLRKKKFAFLLPVI